MLRRANANENKLTSMSITEMMMSENTNKLIKIVGQMKMGDSLQRVSDRVKQS